MLATLITALFTFAGVLAVAVIAHSMLAARDAYARLMREGEVMRAGLALQASAREMSLRPQLVQPVRRAVAMRRPAGLRPQLQVCAA